MKIISMEQPKTVWSLFSEMQQKLESLKEGVIDRIAFETETYSLYRKLNLTVEEKRWLLRSLRKLEYQPLWYKDVMFSPQVEDFEVVFPILEMEDLPLLTANLCRYDDQVLAVFAFLFQYDWGRDLLLQLVKVPVTVDGTMTSGIFYELREIFAIQFRSQPEVVQLVGLAKYFKSQMRRMDFSVPWHVSMVARGVLEPGPLDCDDEDDLLTALKAMYE